MAVVIPKTFLSDVISQQEAVMHNKPVALVIGVNRGIGLQIAKDFTSHRFTVGTCSWYGYPGG